MAAAAGGIDIQIRNAEDFAQLSRRIRAHGDRKAIQREMYAGLNRATKGIRSDMQASIAPSLPSRGGLAGLVAGTTKFSTRSRGGGANVGIRIQAKNNDYDVASMNRGRLRHPTFGHQPWVTQTEGIDEGFLDEPFEKSADEVRRDISRVMESIARKVEH